MYKILFNHVENFDKKIKIKGLKMNKNITTSLCSIPTNRYVYLKFQVCEQIKQKGQDTGVW